MTLTTQLQLLIDSWLHNLPFFVFKREIERVERHGLQVSYADLKLHHLADGNIGSLVSGLIYAQQHGLRISHGNASARELAAKFAGRTLTQQLQQFHAAGVRDLDSAPLRVEDPGQPAPPRESEAETETWVQQQLRQIHAEFDRETGWLLNRRGERICSTRSWGDS